MNDARKVILLSDVRHILDGSTLSKEARLCLVRNMVLFIARVSIDLEEYEETRRDTIVRVAARDCEKTESKVDEWIEKSTYNRYYLSNLRRALIEYTNKGNIQQCCYKYGAIEADLSFCYDVLVNSSTINSFKEAVADTEVYPISLTATDIENILKKTDYNIQICLRNMRFLFDGGVVDESNVASDLKMWAMRTIYLEEGSVDMVHLVNTVNVSVTNRAHNIRDHYTTQKRNSGLLRTKKATKDSHAEYTRVTVPITEDHHGVEDNDFEIRDSPIDYINSSNAFTSKEKLRIARFFSVASGQQDMEFISWLDETGNSELLKNKGVRSRKEEELEYRELLLKFLEIEYLLPKLKKAWRIYYNVPIISKEIADPDILVKQDLLDIKKIQNMSVSKRVKGYILILEYFHYTPEFVEFAKDNGLAEEDLNRLSKRELTVWVEALYQSLTEQDEETLTKIRARLEKEKELC